MPIDHSITDGWFSLALMFSAELLDRQPAHRRLLEHLGLDAVDRDLRPDQQAEPVGQLVRVRVQRVVRAQDGRAELLGVVDQLVAAGVVDREALRPWSPRAGRRRAR